MYSLSDTNFRLKGKLQSQLIFTINKRDLDTIWAQNFKFYFPLLIFRMVILGQHLKVKVKKARYCQWVWNSLFCKQRASLINIIVCIILCVYILSFNHMLIFLELNACIISMSKNVIYSFGRLIFVTEMNWPLFVVNGVIAS